MRDTEYLSVFSHKVGKYEPEKLCIWTLFKQGRHAEFFYFLRYINTNTLKLKCSLNGDINSSNDTSVFPIFENCFLYHM